MEEKKRIVRVKTSKGERLSNYSKVIVSKVSDITLLYVGFGMTKIYASNVVYNMNTDWVRAYMLNGEEIKINKDSLNMTITKQLYKVEFDGETEWFIIDKNMDYTTDYEDGYYTIEKCVNSMTWEEIFKSTL